MHRFSWLVDRSRRLTRVQSWLSSHESWVVTAFALVVLVAVSVGVDRYASSHVLTISQPEGGTLTTDGITCGTRGSDCTMRVANNRIIEFQAQPDDGYLFAGYVGDCSPAGRVFMTEPRTCGATFWPIDRSATNERIHDTPPTSLLTIAKPTGGTIVGEGGIMCGSMGSNCSVQQTSGTVDTLKAIANNGYAFRAFTGDCSPQSGQTVMDGPRTCSATFVSTREVERHKTVQHEAGPHDIQEALDRYRTALQKLDFEALRRVYPTAPDVFRKQLRWYKKLTFSYTDTPTLDEDTYLGGERAVAEVGVMTVGQLLFGDTHPPDEYRIRFSLFRQDDHWIIDHHEILLQ